MRRGMINPILVGKGNKLHSGSHDGYEVRAFPFDLSHPGYQYDLLPVEKRRKTDDERRMLEAYFL